MSNEITVGQGWGMGDAIVVSGAVAYLAEKYSTVWLPCSFENYDSIKSFYVNHPNVKVFPMNLGDFKREYKGNPFNCYWERYEGVIDVPEPPKMSWDEWTYDRLGVPFVHRWASCPIEKAAQEIEQIPYVSLNGGLYYLVHDDSERGFKIMNHLIPQHPLVKVIRVTKHESFPNILSWIRIIRQAAELHFMDSSFWHLTECLVRDPPMCDKFIHLYLRPCVKNWSIPKTRFNWQYYD